jgi:hypothetical protein
MFGYLLLAVSLSAFFGAFFFIVIGEPTGVGLMAFIISVVWGVMWQVKRNNKKKQPNVDENK